MKEHLPENYLEYLRSGNFGRNDLSHNPEVLFQSLAYERSVTEVLYNLDNFESLKVLDVGCGEGSSLINLIKLGFDPTNLSGIDILVERISIARRRFPQINFIEGDAANMPFGVDAFDLIMESTMFIQITDESLAKSIASEMMRVTKKGGYILLLDWRYSKPWNSKYCGLSTVRLKKLFAVGSLTDLMKVKRGALIPYAGRFISRYVPSVYFLTASLLPFMSGQVAYLLKKR